jgi:hypothetical protein
MPHPRESSNSWVRPAVGLATIFAAWIATVFAAIGMWIDSHGDAFTRCFLDSQYPGVVISEDVNVAAAYATAFPAGRYCLWKAYDGTIAVEQTGWINTWVALGFLVLACVAVLALIRTEWWVPATLGMLVVILGWIGIIVTSDTIVSPVLWPELPPIQYPPE